jgi:hypothetical protein
VYARLITPLGGCVDIPTTKNRENDEISWSVDISRLEARISGDPVGLASALQKLAAAAEQIPLDASPQTSHLFIVNPLAGRSFMQLFSTHPPLEERITWLLAKARQRT